VSIKEIYSLEGFRLSVINILRAQLVPCYVEFRSVVLSKETDNKVSAREIICQVENKRKDALVASRLSLMGAARPCPRGVWN
jgi:hypothetical protein